MERILPIIDYLLASPITWGFATIVIAAMAASGRFSMNATKVLLVLAWIVAFVGLLRSETITKFEWLPRSLLLIFISSGLAIGLYYLGIWCSIIPQSVSQPEIITRVPTSNIELKKQANQLSNEILQFLSDRKANEPRVSFKFDEKMMSKKNGTETVNRNSAAFKRATEAWQRDGEESSRYYEKMGRDFAERYASRYENIVVDLEKKGAKRTPIDDIGSPQTNPITIEKAAIRLGVMANELPDTN